MIVQNVCVGMETLYVIRYPVHQPFVTTQSHHTESAVHDVIMVVFLS